MRQSPSRGNALLLVLGTVLAGSVRASELISAAALPAAPSPNGDSWIPAVSDDGRWVVFATSADNLVEGDDNRRVDVVRYDRQTGNREVVSRAADAPSNGDASYEPVDVSNDGRFVMFVSAASNLVANDTNGRPDLFRKDMQSGEIRRIAWSAVYPDPPWNASLSGDGLKTVMSEPGVKWLPPATSSHLLIQVDWNTQSAGVIATAHAPTADAPALAGDGSCILYRTMSAGFHRVSLRPLPTGAEQWIDTAPLGAPPNGSTETFRVAADCSVVGFQSMATNLVAGQPQASNQVYRRTIGSGSLVRVSSGNDDPAILRGMSPEGRHFVYDRLEDNGTPWATSYTEYRDMQLPAAQRADWLEVGWPAYVGTSGAVLTLGSGALANDLNGVADVHVSPAPGASMQLLVPPASLLPVVAPNGSSGQSTGRDELAGGSIIAFTSLATNLLDAGLETDTRAEVYLRDRFAQTTSRLLAALPVQADADVQLQDVTPDGRFFLLGSAATNLVPGDSNGLSDTFVYDRIGGSMTRVSVSPQGQQAQVGPLGYALARFSDAGRFVVFNAYSPNIVPAPTTQQAMVHDLGSGVTRALMPGSTADTELIDVAAGAAYALAWNLGLQDPGCGVIGIGVANGSVECPLRRLDGTTINDLILASVSADARFLIYPEESSPQPTFLLRDRWSNQVRIAEVDIAGPSTAVVAQLSGNGRYLAVIEYREGRAYLLVQDLVMGGRLLEALDIGGYDTQARINHTGTAITYTTSTPGGQGASGLRQVHRLELRGEGVFGGGWQGGFE